MMKNALKAFLILKYLIFWLDGLIRKIIQNVWRHNLVKNN